jgi:hypothetical protein
MKRFYSTLCVLCAAASIFFLHCSTADLTGGGTIETTNGIVTGMVVHSSGEAAPGTKVKLLTAGFDPVKDTVSVITVFTDTQGNYAFPHVHSGDYSIQMIDPSNGTSAFVQGIHVLEDTATVSVAVLNVPGSIKVSLPSGINSATGYLYIPGTTLFTFLNKRTDFVTLDSVPAGFIPAIAYSSTNDTAMATIRYGVRVASGDTAVIWNPSWKYTRVLYLNTSATGANVAGAVTNFPVLVTVNAGEFDFSQAQAGGADIRFTKSNHAFLKYEIERWDPVAGRAEVWVKVDTVRGNDSMQSITMYWGNPGASDSSNGTAVFDTAAGFEGVWHLGERSGSANDATINKFNGGRNGNQQRIPGVIGYGQNYGSLGDYTDMGNVGNPGTSGFTVCAWIKSGSAKSYRTIMSKSVGGPPSSTYGWLLELDPSGSLLVFMATDTGAWGNSRTFILGSKTDIVDSAVWHHVAAIVDRSGNNQCKVFIDGSDVSDLPAAGDITKIGALVNSTPMRLGADGKGDGPWKGSLDECSIAFRVRSPDWIKLCYMNQRTDDKLVFFRENTNK